MRQRIGQSSSVPREPVANSMPRAIGVEADDLTRYARHLYRVRRQRDALFGPIFGEPAWDMMLDLFIRQNDRSATSISSLCIAASVPQTTALRWITAMIADGTFTREDDPFDRRRSYVQLSADTRQRMVQLLQTMLEADPHFEPVAGAEHHA